MGVTVKHEPRAIECRNHLSVSWWSEKTFLVFVTSIDIPDLIEIQKRSYEEFLQMEVEPEWRKDQGLQAALASVFPIADYKNTAALEFSVIHWVPQSMTSVNALSRGLPSCSLKLRVRLIVFDKEDKAQEEGPGRS